MCSTDVTETINRIEPIKAYRELLDTFLNKTKKMKREKKMGNK
jgi:hypothetical protein